MKSKIRVKANQTTRTFTIRAYDEVGKLSAKYRTNTMSKEEFEIEENNTENDWRQFLKSDNYYKVK